MQRDPLFAAFLVQILSYCFPYQTLFNEVGVNCLVLFVLSDPAELGPALSFASLTAAPYWNNN